MVGMHDVGFERLVKALDEYAGRHGEDEVAMQIGSTQYRPSHMRWFTFKPALDEDIAWADMVVSHGSIGLLDAVQLGKRMLAVPRLSRFGEVFNDHQVRSSLHFSSKFGFPVVLEMSDLEQSILEAKAAPAPQPVSFQPTGLYRELDGYLASLAARSRSGKSGKSDG